MTPLYDQFRSEKYFASLDGLRAISVIGVIWHHTASGYFQNVAFLTRGHLGVDLFFGISGFLITTLLLRERESKGVISLRNFYIRRVLRIFPLYYTTIAVYVVLVLIFEGNSRYGMQFFKNLPYYLTYSSNWFVERNDVRVIFYIAWSLATEEQFYLCWPSVERFLKGNRPVFIMITTIIAVQLVDRGVFDAILPSSGLLHRIIVNVAPPICMGVLLAHLLHNRRGFDIARRILGYRWSSLALLSVLAVTIALPSPDKFVVQCLMVLLVASCVIREDHWLAGIFGSLPFRKIGMVSYGMYLMHMLAFHVVNPAANFLNVHEPISIFAATTLATFVAATISFTYYEGYFLSLKKRFPS